jgi:hypothetical protein
LFNVLPSEAKAIVEELEPLVKSWPIEVSMDHVLRWILQFDSSDYAVAARIVRHLSVFGSREIRTALEIAHTKLVRVAAQKAPGIRRDNTLYAGVGSASKSGGMMAYYYRLAVDLPEADFFTSDEGEQIDFAHIDNIVLVDDVIGTGKTVAGEVERIAKEVYSLVKTRNIYVLAVAGYEDGMEHVIRESGATVVAALEYSAHDTVSSLDSLFYKDQSIEDRELLRTTIQRYCRAISTSDLGFGKVGGLLVFEHNTPNTTLPIIWSRGKNWFPLFPRAMKIPGAAKLIKSAKEELEKQEAIPIPVQPPLPETLELTVFVEGKIEELFFDICRNYHHLAERLGVKDVVAVALGGLHQSEKMIEVLRSARKHAILVLDGDEHTRRVISGNNKFSEIPVVFMWPNTIALLDIGRLYSDRVKLRFLPELPPADSADTSWFMEAERAIFKRGSVTSNADRITSIFQEYLDILAYGRLIDEMRGAIARLLSLKPVNDSK